MHVIAQAKDDVLRGSDFLSEQRQSSVQLLYTVRNVLFRHCFGAGDESSGGDGDSDSDDENYASASVESNVVVGTFKHLT